MEQELYHYGVPNQKWGKRRWQNPDGSLTEEGRKHYGVGLARINRVRKENKLRKLKSNVEKADAFLKDDKRALKKAQALETQAKRTAQYQQKTDTYYRKQRSADRSFFLQDYKQGKADKAYKKATDSYKVKNRADAKVSKIIAQESKMEVRKIKNQQKYDKLAAKYIDQYSKEYYKNIFK